MRTITPVAAAVFTTRHCACAQGTWRRKRGMAGLSEYECRRCGRRCTNEEQDVSDHFLERFRMCRDCWEKHHGGGAGRTGKLLDDESVLDGFCVSSRVGSSR